MIPAFLTHVHRRHLGLTWAARTDPWMAAAYSRDDNEKAAGALFCHFHEAEADCYFKDINGSTLDSFKLLSGL